jgi:hypothetical protein
MKTARAAGIDAKPPGPFDNVFYGHLRDQAVTKMLRQRRRQAANTLAPAKQLATRHPVAGHFRIQCTDRYRAEPPLHCREPREARSHLEILGPRGIEAANQRIGNPLGELSSEAAAEKLGNTLLRVLDPARNGWFRQHP